MNVHFLSVESVLRFLWYRNVKHVQAIQDVDSVDMLNRRNMFAFLYHKHLSADPTGQQCTFTVLRASVC